MSIKKRFDKDDQVCWEVYVSKRSKIYPSFRPQKRLLVYGSESKARRKEVELKEEIVLLISKKENASMTWGEAVKSWEASNRLCTNLQQDTLDDYVSSLNTWTFDIRDKPLAELTVTDTRICIQKLSQAGKSNSFQNKVLHAIRRVYKWAKDEGYNKSGNDSITRNIFVSKTEDKVPDILSMDEIKKLLHSAKVSNHPWYPIWATAIWTGMRTGELYALAWDSVDFTNNRIVVSRSFNKKLQIYKSTKSGYFRSVPINDSLRELLLELRSSSTTAHVLPRFKDWDIGHQAKILKLYCCEIGVSEVNFHSLRACFATHLLSNNVSAAIVMKICGWKTLETMQRYIRLAGIYEKGSTDCLNSLAPRVSLENVLAILNN